MSTAANQYVWLHVYIAIGRGSDILKDRVIAPLWQETMEAVVQAHSTIWTLRITL
jgi:two-component SAPR family response regulator